jgi:hypothetical protein
MGISCKKFVAISPPADQSSAATLFSDSSTAIGALMGVYISIVGDGTLTYQASIDLGLYADELSLTTSNLNLQQASQSALLPDNSTMGYFWSSPYKFIYLANICIENGTGSSPLSDATKAQLTGESKFLRAFCYFQLVRLYGDVPLVLTTDYQSNASMPRAPQAQVTAQIISDLKDAKSLLGNDYPGTESVRANKWAASALLARVYLYQKDWADAESEANGVIQSGMYTLETDLHNVFVKDNGEAILQLMPRDGYPMYEGQSFIPGSPGTRPSYPLTTNLLNAFEPNDGRRQVWVDSTIVGGQAYYYPYKYKTTSVIPATEYYTILRLSEQYLIRAEAGAEQKELETAAQDLNKIRARAGLPPTTAGDQASLIQAIYKERQVELFAEDGQRWFDLQRTGTADSVLKPLKPQTWKSTAVLFPIPLTEIQTNPFLTQNLGY